MGVGIPVLGIDVPHRGQLLVDRIDIDRFPGGRSAHSFHDLRGRERGVIAERFVLPLESTERRGDQAVEAGQPVTQVQAPGELLNGIERIGERLLRHASLYSHRYRHSQTSAHLESGLENDETGQIMICPASS